MTKRPPARFSCLLRSLLGLSIIVVLGLTYLALFPGSQRADRSFDTSVATPAYVTTHPVLSFDQGHNNAHSASRTYRPFAKLARADGYEVRIQKGTFTKDALHGSDVLMIVNADGGTNPKLFGYNLVPLRRGIRGTAAFTNDEVGVIQQWVKDGGSLLLVADHAPFGTAAAGLAAAFEVTMHGGWTEVPNQSPDQRDPSVIEFTSANGLLAEHPINRGRQVEEQVRRIVSFTGQSLDGPPGSSLLMLPASAIDVRPMRPDEVEREPANPPAGAAQAVAFEYGRGRVVILGEAAMITAQIDQQGHRFGMNQPDIDNRQFALNVLHWLTHAL